VNACRIIGQTVTRDLRTFSGIAAYGDIEMDNNPSQYRS